MEIALVKSEVSSGARRRLRVSEGETTKCVKRRRREIACDVNKDQRLDQSSSNTAVKRSSRFRGVSRHRWTGRYEAHLWDKGSWNTTQKKKGKQVYLGAYDEEESAARAYDLAALKYWGPTTFTNFPVSDYDKEIEIMQNVTKEEYLASLRRKSSGFSRGVSKYRGVARHHHNGRWEARIGRVFGNKYLYLGTYSTQEEAAHAYDIAAIEYRGINAVTNFDLSTYIRWLRPGANTLVMTTPPAQEQRTNADLQSYPSESFLVSNPFAREDIESPRKQEFHPQQIHGGSCTKSSSSPTALSLLLRSSIFKELVEKNSNAGDEEDVEGEEETRMRQQLGGEDEYGGMFYDGISDISYVCSSNGDGVPGIELHEESPSPYFDRTGQALWNNASLSMSPIG